MDQLDLLGLHGFRPDLNRKKKTAGATFVSTILLIRKLRIKFLYNFATCNFIYVKSGNL